MDLTLDQLNPRLQTSKEMSKRYVWMNTAEIVNGLLDLKKGGESVFELRSIQGKKPRKTQLAGRGIHIARVKLKIPYEIDGETLYPELVIKNSYDGSCPLIVEMGVFRLVCTNGLTIKSKDLGGIKVRHTGTSYEAVQDIIKGMASQLPRFQQVQQQLAQRNLTDIEIRDFAKKAARIRWEKVAEDADFEMLLETVRPEDEGMNMWKVYNVVQEKLIQGGVKLEGMRRTGRKVRNASEDLRINQELFQLALSYCESNEGEVADLKQEDFQVEEVLN